MKKANDWQDFPACVANFVRVLHLAVSDVEFFPGTVAAANAQGALQK